MAHSWVVRGLLTAGASLDLVKEEKENAAVYLSSYFAAFPLNNFLFLAEDTLSHLTCNNRNLSEKANNIANPKMAN